MNRETDVAIRQIEFELEKAEHGLATPYDPSAWAIAQDAGRGPGRM